jgi:hypothetical protein
MRPWLLAEDDVDDVRPRDGGREMDEHGSLYASVTGVSTETFATNGLENRRVDSLHDG